jgi:hypothetical protein
VRPVAHASYLFLFGRRELWFDPGIQSRQWLRCSVDSLTLIGKWLIQ